MKTRIVTLLVALCAFASCTQPVVEVFGSISGYVVNEDTGAAIGGARVTITPTGSSQVTSTDGEFLFDNLDAQEYTISIKKDGFQDMSQKVSVKAGVTSSVQVALKAIQPVLKVDPEVLDFGDESTSLALDITNTGKGTLEWTIEEEVDWLTCGQASGSTSDKVSSVVVKVSREGLERGSYSETIVISSNGGSKIVKVKMSVGNSIKISVEPDEIDFGSVESEVEITVKNNGTSSVRYTAESANGWLTLSKSSGTVQTTDYIHAIVSREDLSAGSYTSSITISTEGGDIIIPVKMQVAVKSAPTVTLEDIEDITYSSAVAHGTVVSVGSSKIFRYGFCVSTENKKPTVDDEVYSLGDCMEPKSFSGTLNNLESTTTYYIRAFAENQEGIAYSNAAQQFTTTDLPKLAEVSTGEVSDIQAESAVVGGSVEHLGNVISLKAHGHVWNTTGTPTLTNGDNTDLGELATTSKFSSTLEGLEAGTKYYVRAYATNEKGTAYGEEVTFTTSLGDVEIKTLEATSITHESAVVEGEILSDGKNEILEKGIVWATYPEPDRYDNKIVAQSGFSCVITGLDKKTTYYARAYVKTSLGKYYYGNEVSFTTTEFVTLPEVATGTVGEVTHETVEVTGSIVSTGSTTVTVYGHVLGTNSSVTLVSGLTAKSAFEPTDAPGEYTSSLSGLSANTTYYVRAYATNSKGTVYGDAVSFTTEKTPMIVSDAVLESLSWNSAEVSATLSQTDGHVIDYKGFAISKYDEDDDDFHFVDGNDFRTTITGLEGETKYKVYAFVETTEGNFYMSEYYLIFTTPSAPENPTNGLYAYYTFEDNTNNTVAGASNASGINTSYVDGVQGSKALKFTSQNAKLNIPDPLIDGCTFSISFWVKDINDGHLFSVVSSGDYKNSNILSMENGQLTYLQSGYNLWYRWGNDEYVTPFTHSTLSSGWHLVTMTSKYDGIDTDVCLYIDGEYLDKITLSSQGYQTVNFGTKFIFGGPLSRSGFNVSLNWISMSIDNLRIYNSRVLTAEEVKQIYEYEK